MNLREFLNYKTDCPLCGSPLQTKFSPSRRGAIRYEDDKLIIAMTMKGMRSCEPDYKIGYSFGMDDGSFGVEFYDDGWRPLSSAPLWLIGQFRTFNRNIGPRIGFSRECINCRDYTLGTIGLDLLQMAPIELNVIYEQYILDQPGDDIIKHFELTNWCPDRVFSHSQLRCWTSATTYEKAIYHQDLPYIPFVSKEETAKRLATLAIFS